MGVVLRTFRVIGGIFRVISENLNFVKKCEERRSKWIFKRGKEINRDDKGKEKSPPEASQ